MNNINESHYNDEIDLKELFNALILGKWIILTFITFASILSIIYSLSLPNIYQSKALLLPNESGGSVSRALQSYSGLAGLAGINLPSQEGDSNSMRAKKKINSLSFFESNIMPNIFLPNLMALESWNPDKNLITYDNNIYDVISNTWTRKFSYPQKQIPSPQESFQVFKSNHLSIAEDSMTGFITISVKHQSPYIAKNWTELLINQINSFYREKDKTEAEKAVNYLNEQISKTKLTEIKQVIAALLQQETQKLALIEANEFYVFEYIDPPVVMEKKSEPSRSILCIIGAFIGGVLGVIIVLFRYYLFLKRNS